MTVLGTGFGPCDRQPPDGFAVPESPVYTLLDPVEAFAADLPLEALWAGASPGRVGVQAVRVRVAAELPDAPAFPIKVRINGRESNTVMVPLELP